MTISLSVILMETTGIETSFFFPLIIALISAKWVGDSFNEGIYDTVIEVNKVPMLPWEPLPQYKGLTANEILSKPVICIKLVDSAHYIYEMLIKCQHNGFPVVDNVVGVSFSILQYSILIPYVTYGNIHSYQACSSISNLIAFLSRNMFVPHQFNLNFRIDALRVVFAE